MGTLSGAPTLDGLAYFARYYPSDAAAIRWLQVHVAEREPAGRPLAVGPAEPRQPIIVEATGGSYSQYGRVSMITGFPTLLGWDFHELQWRGTAVAAEISRRRADVETIYRSRDPNLVLGLLKQYGVTYVYVGPLERETYARDDPSVFDKFRVFMDVVYDRNGVTIYQVR